MTGNSRLGDVHVIISACGRSFHPVYQRLRLAERVFGADPSNVEARLSLHLAVLAHEAPHSAPAFT